MNLVDHIYRAEISDWTLAQLAESQTREGAYLLLRYNFYSQLASSGNDRVQAMQLQFSESSGILNRNCGIEAMRGRFISRSPNESFLDMAGG
jgi:hypothetical protein